jgi:chromo domain-containing protein 1
VHPDFEFFSCVPDFGQLLQGPVRIWSLGNHLCVKHNQAAVDCPAVAQHDCIEIFPIGGLIYITDDVFEEKPHLALEIVRLFLAKIDMLQQLAGSDSPWQTINDVELYWRLCVRPELMEYLLEKCEEEKEAIEAGNLEADARARLYTLLSDSRLIEQEPPSRPLHDHDKVDNFPILSERRIFVEGEPIDYFKALSRSRREANLRMIRYYSGLHVDMRQDYRYFYVIHTDPLGSCAKQWKEEIQTLSDVITPERYIAELSKDVKSQSTGQLSEFYERYILNVNDATSMEPRPKKKTAGIQQVTETQVSLEDGEVRGSQ